MRFTLAMIVATAMVLGGSTVSLAQNEKPATDRKPTFKKPPPTGDLTQPIKPPPVKDPKSTIEKASYIIGYSTIENLRKNDADYNFDQILAGLNAAQNGAEIEMTAEERVSVIRAFQQLVQEKQQAKKKEIADRNSVESEAAFKEFAGQEGAKELEDGIMYVVLKEGDGDVPEAPDKVKIAYKGSYPDGEVFDSTEEKGGSIENGVTRFVPGFSTVLQNMKVGSKWKVIIRGDKAYGMRPRPPMEVNKTLIFEIELLEILVPQ